MAKKKKEKETTADVSVFDLLVEKFGAGSITTMKSGSIVGKEDTIPTGSITLDKALGGFGYPKGRIIEVYGAESSGKTTLILHAIANAQKQGALCLFVDAEHAIDPSYASNLGVDVDKLIISQPDYGEQALEIVETAVDSGKVGVVVVDSVAALTPKAELEGEMGQSHMGLQARLMSQALRKLTSKVAKTGTTLFFINQLRSKIGVVFGSPNVTTGGNALKYYASVRLDVRRTGSVKDGEEATANTTIVKVVKNKVAPPFKTAAFDIRFGRGIDTLKEIFTVCAEKGAIKKGGAWYTFGELRGQGANAFMEAMSLPENEEALIQLHALAIAPESS